MALQMSRKRRRSLRNSKRSPAGAGPQGHVGLEMLDRLLEAVALDEPHGVVRAAAAVGAQTVNRHDPGVLQPAGDLRLGDEPLPAHRVVGVLLEDLLQRHLAVQLAVERHEHLAEPAPRVRPEQAEPLAIAGRPADRQTAGAVGVVIIVGLGGVAVLGPCDPGERGLDLGLAQLGQAGAGGSVGGDGGQAFLHVATVRFQMNLGQRIQQPSWRPSGRRGLRGDRPGSGTCRGSMPERRA